MNHLTNLYKNKCEQLQEQVQYLTRRLNEKVIPTVIRYYQPYGSSEMVPMLGSRPGSLDHVPPTNPDRFGFPISPNDGTFFYDNMGYTWVFSEGLWKCVQLTNIEGTQYYVRVGDIYDPSSGTSPYRYIAPENPNPRGGFGGGVRG